MTDRPWEGNTSAYYTIFQDGDLYRMYYRGSHFDEKAQEAPRTAEVTCYAESKRRRARWTKPELGLFELEWLQEPTTSCSNGIGTHCFVAFQETTNPDCSAERALQGRSPAGGRSASPVCMCSSHRTASGGRSAAR